MGTVTAQRIHDPPQWEARSNSPWYGFYVFSFTHDMRRGPWRDPYAYRRDNNTNVSVYHSKYDAAVVTRYAATPADTGNYYPFIIFVPSGGHFWTLPAGWTANGGTVNIVSTTVRAGTYADRGDGVGYVIRIIGNSAGGSGKTEERHIISNTAATGGGDITITLGDQYGNAQPLSFTPQVGDRFELLTGALYYQTMAGGMQWWSLDIPTGRIVARTNTNLINPTGGLAACVLDEQYVRCGYMPGEGFFGVRTATATGANTLTGTSAAGGGTDAAQETNEWSNFQIRVVRDVAQPQAVGQRCKIASHTNGDPNVYTLSAPWGVQPSNTCQYVIEGIGDIVLFTDVNKVVYTYPGNFRADGAWSTGAVAGAAQLQIPNTPAAIATQGVSATWAFGFRALDPGKFNRYSGLYFHRGGVNTSRILVDCLDLATLSWSTGIGGTDVLSQYQGLVFAQYYNQPCAVYDANGSGTTPSGRYWYFPTQLAYADAGSMIRIDLLTRTLSAFTCARVYTWTASGGWAPRMFQMWDESGGRTASYLYISAAPNYGPSSRYYWMFRVMIP